MEAKAVSILKLGAWINLAVGMALAASVWPSDKMRPADIVLSAAFVAAGFIGWAFFLVVCSIAESLIEIRSNTAQPVKSRLFDRGGSSQ